MVAGPGDVAVGTHENEPRLVGRSPVAVAVAYDFEGHAQGSCRGLERRDNRVFGTDREQAEARAELLEDVTPAGQSLRREVMAGPGLERMRAAGAAQAIGEAEDDRGGLVLRLIGQHARVGGGCMLLPGALEFGPIALRTVAVEEFPVR